MKTADSGEEPDEQVRRPRGRERAAETPGMPESPPTSRREMKARGILLTTEIPVIQEPPGWGGKASVAVSAHRASADRTDAGRAVAAVGSAPSTTPPASPSARPTGRRPVVRAPLTARGLRTVDESGAVTGVHSSIGYAVGRALESEISPASWESAVSLPAVALGIEDVAGTPTQAGSTGAERVAPPPVPQSAPDRRPDLPSAPGPDRVRAPAESGSREAAGRRTGLHRAEPVRSGGRAMRIGGIAVAVAALAALIYLLSTGTLTSLFAQGTDGLGSGAGTLAVAVGALWMPRALHQAAVEPSIKEIRDR